MSEVRRKIDKKFEHLLLSEKLEEVGSPKLIIMSSFVTCLILLILVAWAYFTRLDQVANAPGLVVPAGKIQVIQHLEGGIVVDTMVKDGEAVEAGQTLVRFSPEAAVSELDRLKNRENSLSLDIARLEAFTENRTMTPEELKAVVPNKDLSESRQFNTQVLHTLTLLKQHHLNKEKDRQVLITQAKKLSEELDNLDLQITNGDQRIKVIEDEVALYEDLSKTKSVSKVNLLESREKLSEAKGEQLEAIRVKQNSLNQKFEVEEKLEALEANYNKIALQELTRLTSELAEVQNLLRKAQDKVDRLTVVSPVNGIVQGMEVRPGSVVQPGEVLFEVVPLREQMVIEARVATTDIGHVKIGDHVNVKITTYDFANYGTLDGVVESISPSSFLTENDEPFFKAIITLDKNFLGDDPSKYMVLPGMTVVADIKTDEQSLLSYLLNPLRRALNSSFTER